MCSSILEASELRFLRQEAGDRVVRQEHDGKVSGKPGRSHVADDDFEVRAAILPAQLVDHRSGELDAGDLQAASGERERDASRADRELRDAAAISQVGQKVDGGVKHGRVVHRR